MQQLAFDLSKTKGGTKRHPLPSPTREAQKKKTRTGASVVKGAPDDENNNNGRITWVNIRAAGLGAAKAQHLSDGGRPQPAKAYCQGRELTGVAADA